MKSDTIAHIAQTFNQGEIKLNTFVAFKRRPFFNLHILKCFRYKRAIEKVATHATNSNNSVTNF